MSADDREKSDFDRRIDLETNTKFIERIDAEFGDIVVIQHQSTRQKFMMKEKIFHDKFSFLEELNKTKNRHFFSNPNILRFVDFSTINKIDKVEQIYKIRLFYEFYQNNVRREMQTRLKSEIDFTLEEITYMLYDMILACGHLQEKNVNHGDLSPDIILRNQDGHFVLGDKLKYRTKHPQNLIDKFIRSEKLYISPELFKFIKTRNSDAIDRIDYFISDVFILGMCILEAGLMTDSSVIYKRGNASIDKAVLAELISAFESRYSENPLVCTVLQQMLEIDETKRPDFLTLKYSLPSYQEIINYFKEQNEKIKNTPITKGTNYGLSVGKNGNQVNAEKVNDFDKRANLIKHGSPMGLKTVETEGSKNFDIFNSIQNPRNTGFVSAEPFLLNQEIKNKPQINHQQNDGFFTNERNVGSVQGNIPSSKQPINKTSDNYANGLVYPHNNNMNMNQVNTNPLMFNLGPGVQPNAEINVLSNQHLTSPQNFQKNNMLNTQMESHISPQRQTHKDKNMEGYNNPMHSSQINQQTQHLSFHELQKSSNIIPQKGHPQTQLFHGSFNVQQNSQISSRMQSFQAPHGVDPRTQILETNKHNFPPNYSANITQTNNIQHDPRRFSNQPNPNMLQSNDPRIFNSKPQIVQTSNIPQSFQNGKNQGFSMPMNSQSQIQQPLNKNYQTPVHYNEGLTSQSRQGQIPQSTQTMDAKFRQNELKKTAKDVKGSQFQIFQN